MPENKPIPQRAFPTTHWTLVGRAGDAGNQKMLNALGDLLHQYTPCLLAHLVYMKRMAPEQAEDMVQSFVQDKILQGNLLTRANQARGRFRTLLLTALDRFLISEHRKTQAAKRSPGQPVLSLDEVGHELIEPSGESSAFDLEWVRQILTRTLWRVESELKNSDREATWGIFEARILKPHLEGIAAPSYEKLVATFGFETPVQASNALVTAKRMFARLLEEVISEYTTSEAETEEEINALRAILADSVRTLR